MFQRIDIKKYYWVLERTVFRSGNLIKINGYNVKTCILEDFKVEITLGQEKLKVS